jgi:hypothetical protein
VRALRAHEGVAADAGLWAGEVSRQYRRLLLAAAVERREERINAQGQRETRVLRKGMSREAVDAERARLERGGKGAGALGSRGAAMDRGHHADDDEGDEEDEGGDLPYAKALRCRIRYFTDGVVIGSRSFVNEAFEQGRERFGPRRKDGARRLRGPAAALAGSVWNLRDLRKGVV